MKLILLRHAESIFNVEQRYQGQYDCDLSENGRKQLNELSKNFNKKYDYCYASPLKRTKETAISVTGGDEILYDDRIKEIKLGVWETTKITSLKKNLLKNQKFVPDGAETFNDMDDRVKSFLNDLKKKHLDTDTILIVTHGGVIKAIGRILKIEMKNYISNLDIVEIIL